MRITLADCKGLLNNINNITVPFGIEYSMQRIDGSYIVVSSDNEDGIMFGDIKACYYILTGIYDTILKVRDGVL